jgi:hypothetical protein
MSKSQRKVIGVILILMGVISFILAALIVDTYSGRHYFSYYMFKLYPVVLLGIVFTGGGIFVLIGKSK